MPQGARKLGEKFRIVGMTNYQSIINRNQVIVNLADLQEITFRKGAVTFFAVKLTSIPAIGRYVAVQPTLSLIAPRRLRPSRSASSARSIRLGWRRAQVLLLRSNAP
jgi:hypothetical protein